MFVGLALPFEEILNVDRGSADARLVCNDFL